MPSESLRDMARSAQATPRAAIDPGDRAHRQGSMRRSAVPSSLRTLVPAPWRRALGQACYDLRYGWERDIVLLASIPKSGTNYFRLFLTNYVALLKNPEQASIDYPHMVGIFPNCRNYYLTGKRPYRAPEPLLRPFGYADFVFQHKTNRLDYFRGKCVLLVRNPLDNLVSAHYHAEGLPDEEISSTPREAIKEHVPTVARVYAAYREFARKPNFLMVHYEDLTAAPIATFGLVLRWLGIPYNAGLLRKALDFTDIRRVRAYEEDHGPIHAPRGSRGKLTRSGEVGQWKRYLSNEDVERVRAILREWDISFDEFILE